MPVWLASGTAVCTGAGSGSDSGTAKPAAPAEIAGAAAPAGSGEEGSVGGSLLSPSCLSGRCVSLISNGFFGGYPSKVSRQPNWEDCVRYLVSIKMISLLKRNSEIATCVSSVVGQKNWDVEMNKDTPYGCKELGNNGSQIKMS